MIATENMDEICANCGKRAGLHARHGDFCPTEDWYSQTEAFFPIPQLMEDLKYAEEDLQSSFNRLADAEEMLKGAQASVAADSAKVRQLRDRLRSVNPAIGRVMG